MGLVPQVLAVLRRPQGTLLRASHRRGPGPLGQSPPLTPARLSPPVPGASRQESNSHQTNSCGLQNAPFQREGFPSHEPRHA